MRLLLLALLTVLTGCGTVASIKDFTSTGFIMASHGTAGGIWKVIRGSAVYCKITTHGRSPINYRIILQGDTCIIEVQE